MEPISYKSLLTSLIDEAVELIYVATVSGLVGLTFWEFEIFIQFLLLSLQSFDLIPVK